MNTTTIPHHPTRRSLVRPRAIRTLALVASMLAVAACGTGSTTDAGSSASTATPTTVSVASTTTPSTPEAPMVTIARPTATVDQLVGDPDARIHVRCVGHGDVTVMLIAGFGGDLTGWTAVEPAIATRARVCTYDHPGTGTSDPASGIATFDSRATALRTLLQAVGEPGPYVVVGHSFGGAEAVSFASQFPADVAGLVLVDASPVGWPEAICAVADDGTDGASMLRATCSAAFAASGNPEHLDVRAAFAEVASVTSLGDLPMAVITAVDRETPADLAVEERARLTAVWDDGQLAWAALSTEAHLVSVENTRHHIHIDQPELVIDEITRLLP